MNKILNDIFFSGDRDTNICSMLMFECYTNAVKRFVKKFKLKNCNCLLDCVSIKYNYDVSMNRFDHDDFNRRNTNYGYDNCTFSTLKIINFWFLIIVFKI